MAMQQLPLFDPDGIAADLAHEADLNVASPRPHREPCSKCGGTGEYRWGTVTNGVPAKRGMCFPCRGKGYMTPADVNRTSFYWDHRPLSDM